MDEPHIYYVEWKNPDLEEYMCMIPFISNSRRGKLAEEDKRPNTGYLGVGVYENVDGEEEGGNFGRVIKIFYILI